jgi:hypothetical protein
MLRRKGIILAGIEESLFDKGFFYLARLEFCRFTLRLCVEFPLHCSGLGRVGYGCMPRKSPFVPQLLFTSQ